jgi:hypothetical protein
VPELAGGTASKTLTSESKSHSNATLTEKKLSLLFKAEDIEPANSAIWATFGNKGSKPLSYTGEADISTYCKQVLEEVLKAGGLGGYIDCCEELSLSKIRGDIWFVLNTNGFPIGVCEIKNPGEKALTSGFILGQVYDYMKELKLYHGVKFPFGLIFTYTKVRVVWLPDAEEYAASTTKQVLLDANPKGSCSIQGAPTYKEDDESLDRGDGGEEMQDDGVGVGEGVEEDIEVEEEEEEEKKEEAVDIQGTTVFELTSSKEACVDACLVILSVVKKMLDSPIVYCHPFINDSKGRLLTEKSWLWAKKGETNYAQTFTGKVSVQTKKFYLLADFRGGSGGRVWAATSVTGKVCVLKFSQNVNNDEANAQLKDEARICQDVWGKDRFARVQTVAGRPCIVMSFFSPCPSPPPRALYPAIREAIADAANAGVEHRDLTFKGVKGEIEKKWEHVGLYQMKGKWKAALLDFGLTTERSSGTEEEDAFAQRAEKAMLEALGLSVSTDGCETLASDLDKLDLTPKRNGQKLFD